MSNDDNRAMTPRPDISSHVHRFLLVLAGLAWAFFLLSLIPLDHLMEGYRAGAFANAFVMSWISACASTWAAVRIRRRGCYWAVAASWPLAILCGGLLARFLFNEFERGL